MKTLLIDNIDFEGGTQVRWVIEEADVLQYAEAMREGAEFPPIVVFHDGKTYWLADGFHRVLAAVEVGKRRIACEVKKGGKRQALLYACGVNETHGFRRTNEDKRNAVHILLADDEWSKWSDREVAKRCAVSDRFVNGLRQELSANGSQTRKFKRGGKEHAMDVARPVKPLGPRARDPDRQAPLLTNNGGMKILDRLKLLWDQASARERKAFLKWVDNA
jgi:hypothetical protein